ncbi:transcriptional regulator, TetR family [Salinihabitans flavidus]|uniref:Transcriptional regulator, TetR family n=1 Tax=Salinihabitans flavidus TaxID=569882 RepID=A0A1H8MS52_9RHOB|nr:transcriptional regulator BetI [Salinihabitans flavidus]SEO20053.1 transcriptional regulator, TetR family [Salinihabitans flavidus]
MADQTHKPRPARGKRSSIADIRRRELARAALRTIEKHGVKGATVQRVSEEAGISQGLVHYHYKTKADLLEAAVKLTNRLITEEVLLRLRQARTPHERVLSVLEANFSPEVFSKETAQAWASCSGEAAFNPRFARVMNLIERRLISNLAHDLCKIMPADQARQLARILTIMSDGIWLQAARWDGAFDREAAVKPVWDLLALASVQLHR